MIGYAKIKESIRNYSYSNEYIYSFDFDGNENKKGSKPNKKLLQKILVKAIAAFLIVVILLETG